MGIQLFGRWQQKAQQTCMLAMASSNPMQAMFKEIQAKVGPYMKTAVEGLEALSEKERSELIEKNEAKMKTFMNLPPEARSRHLDSLIETEEIVPFVMAINLFSKTV